MWYRVTRNLQEFRELTGCELDLGFWGVTMVDNKDIKLQINEYHKLLEELRAEKIEL